MLNALPEFFHHHRKVAIKIFPSNGLSKCLMQVVWWSEKEGGEKEQIPKQSNLYITAALKIYSPSQLITCHISLKQRNWLIARLFYFRNLCVKNICSERLSPLLDLSSWLTFVYLWLKNNCKMRSNLKLAHCQLFPLFSSISFIHSQLELEFCVGWSKQNYSLEWGETRFQSELNKNVQFLCETKKKCKPFQGKPEMLCSCLASYGADDRKLCNYCFFFF